MSNNLTVSANSGSFIPAPQGVHQGVCVDVIDLGILDKGWGPKPMCRIVFQIDTRMENGKRFIASRDFNKTLNEKGNLLPFLTTWRGQAFTPEELKGFPLEKLIGVNGNVQILHNEGRNGNTYANITAVFPPMPGQQRMVAESYVRMVDRDKQQPQPPQQPQQQATPVQPSPAPPKPPQWVQAGGVDEIPF